MAVELLSLTFNHDAGSARNSALNIRLNARSAVPIPEWLSTRPANFPAAYAIAEVAGAVVVVEGSVKGVSNSVLEIQAVPLPIGSNHVLGPIEPKAVVIGSNGLSGRIAFELARPSFSSSGIGVHSVRWRWMQRTAGSGEFTAFAETSHLIFTVLAVPTAPWVQQPFVALNTQLPWAEVMQWACTWAGRTFTPGVAAAAITLALYSHPAKPFRYNCSFGAPTNYAFPEFDCTAALERLAGGTGRGPNVNCTDCATIVSTFANATGCDLSQARMFNPVVPFAVNSIRLIGNPLFGPVCGAGFFNYHEVAWSGLCGEADEVFDACVELFAPAFPFIATTIVVPAHLPFGFANQGLYRDLLAAPGSRTICQPQPLSRVRRLVF